jgi:glutamate-1-semialdehyde 2,1-aminomutase
MTAGIATLRTLAGPGYFSSIADTTAELVHGIEAAAARAGLPIQAGYAGTMFGFYFLKAPGAQIVDYAGARQHADPARYARFFHAMLAQGVYFAPSQFEAGFVSSAHGATELAATLAAVNRAFDEIARSSQIP